MPGLPDEKEYLFAPYSAFTVISAKWGAGTNADPHVVELAAFRDHQPADPIGGIGEALDRIGALYDIEREINGQPAEIRLPARQKHSAPKVEAFFAWSESQIMRIPGKGDLARAFR